MRVRREPGSHAAPWLLGHFLSYSFIFGVIVLFQADLRRALAELGRSSRLLRLVARLGQDDRAAQLGVIDAIVKAALELARRRVGALVVVERSADLSDVVGSGRRLDAAVSPEILVAIFQPASPIHDGAAVVQGSRVAAAACLLPLSAGAAAPELGTRHRAAIGLAEEVDAAVVVVSEERGEVSVALDGALHRALDEKALRAILFGAFAGSERGGKGGFLARARARAAPVLAGGGKPRAAIRSRPRAPLDRARARAVRRRARRAARHGGIHGAGRGRPRPGLPQLDTLPAEVTVTVSGPWARLRVLDSTRVGPIRIDVTRAGAGQAAWRVRAEALHLPHGLRVESITPSQGTVDPRRELR